MNMSPGRLVLDTVSALNPKRPSRDSAAYGLLNLAVISQYHRAIDSYPVFWLNRNARENERVSTSPISEMTND